MDEPRAAHEQQLAIVEQHMRLGRDHIAGQEQLITQLRYANRDTALAHRVLANLLVAQVHSARKGIGSYRSLDRLS